MSKKQWSNPKFENLSIGNTHTDNLFGIKIAIPSDAWCVINVDKVQQQGPNPQGKCNHSNANNNILANKACPYIHTHSQVVGVDAQCSLICDHPES